VPTDVLHDLDEAAQPYGGVLHLASGGHRTLIAEAMREAAERQPEQEGYVAELEQWTHRYAGGHDGIPSDVRLEGPPPSYGDLVLRWFPRGTLRQPRGGMDHEDASVLAILTADDDERACTSQSNAVAAARGAGRRARDSGRPE
jgi:hypothetical protein